MKRGWRTSEFWVTATAIVGAIASLLAGRIDGTAGVVMAGVAAAAYTISRGLAKQAVTGGDAGPTGPLAELKAEEIDLTAQLQAALERIAAKSNGKA